MRENVLISGEGNVFKRNTKPRRRRRSQSNSLSEGNAPYGSEVDPISHFSISSSPHRNGTVSDVGVDRTNASLRPSSPAPVQSLTRFSPKSLLVESLIDQLCKLMEKDSGKQRKLYHGKLPDPLWEHQYHVTASPLKYLFYSCLPQSFAKDYTRCN